MATNIKRLKRVVRPTLSTGLTLTAANEDYLSIPNAELNTDVPLTGVWAFGGRFTIPTVNPSIIYPMIGRTIAASTNDRYGFWIDSSGVLQVQGRNGQGDTVPSFITTYGGQTIDIKVQYELNDVVTYVNEVEITRVVISTRPATGSTTFWIGAYGDATGLSPNAGRYYDGKVHSFFIGDNEWLLEEGSGAVTVSEVGDYEAGIYTTHAGGIVYINDTMWTILASALKPYAEVLSAEDINLIRDKLVFNGSDEELNLGNELQIPATGVFSIEIEIDTTGLTTSSPFKPHFGRRNATTPSTEYFYFYTLNGELRVQNSSWLIGYLDFIADYPNQVVKCEYVFGEGVDDNVRLILVNGAEKVRAASVTRPVSSLDDWTTGTLSGSNYSANLHSFRFGSETFDLNEGKGTYTVGSEGTVGTITRASMWQESGEVAALPTNIIKTPYFRQHGYKLKLTRDNSDSLTMPPSAWDTHTLIGSTDFYMETKITIRNTYPTVNSKGIMGNSRFSFRTNAFFCWVDSNDRLQVRAGSVGIIPIFSFESTYLGQTIVLRIAYEVDSYRVYVNGSQVFQAVAVQNIISDVQDWATINGYGTAAGTGVVAAGTQSDYDYHYVDFNGDKWDFSESLGSVVKSTLSNEATLQTAHASPEYLDAEVWEKKSFALALNPEDNLEIVRVDGALYYETFGDVDFEVSFRVDAIPTTDYRIIYRKFRRSANQINLSVRSVTGDLYIYIAGTETAAIVSLNIAMPLGDNTVKVKGGITYLNGVVVDDSSARNAEFMFIGTAYDHEFGQFMYDFSVLGKKFSLTEGLGNEVFSDEPTYSLALTGSNTDMLTSADLYVVAPTGIYFVEIDIDTTRVAGTVSICGTGNSGVLQADQWNGLFITNALYFYYRAGANINYAGLLVDYPTQIVTIRYEWTDTNVNLYVNGDLKASAAVLRPDASTTPFRVGSRDGVQNLSADIYSININDEHIWEFDEDEGYDSISDSGRVLTGSTLHGNALAYWNDEVRVKTEIVGTIETLHAQGNEYINYGVWRKQLSSGIWVPYSQSDTQYYQALDNASLDYSAEITPAKLVVDPSSTGVGWYTDIDLNTNATPGATFDIWGRNTGASSRMFLIVLNADLTWRYRTGINLSVVDFHLTYGNMDSVVINCIYEATDAVIYINEVEVARSPHLNDFPTNDVVNPFFVGKATPGAASTCPYGVNNFNINGEFWNVNEGSGFTIKSQNGIEVDGGTTHANGEVYFDAEVWKEIV